MIEQLDQLLESWAWPMTPPPAYGWFHISYTLLGFVLCAFAAWKARNVSDKAARWILFSIGAFLAITEVYKQFFYYFAIEDNRYSWGDLPFQLCSIPMYMCLIAPWLKPGKLQRGMYSFMVLYNLLGGAISFTEPSGLLQNYWFLTVHSLLWHMILVFVGLFICFSGRGGTERKDYWGATWTFVSLCAIAFTINCVVQNVFDANINMFFVGPGNSPLAVFKNFSEWFGWQINTLIYVPVVCIGAYIVFIIIYFCRNRKKASV